ncbi:hypothetical protein HNR40_008682 [Nonomuraea endophytica]|uniref:Uncharacterized protein n=1 Tax=Nonomuraea endophytica TaxID=714136 RepID=A0A7W8ACK7_9ACTN|nr:hypothetical protein [Nonomuraea endophytica]
MRGNWGAWALLGAGCGWSLIAARPSRLPLWVPMALVFLGSGSLFAWGCWKLLWAVVRLGDFVTPEYPVVAVMEHALSVCAGLVLLAVVLRTYRAQAVDSAYDGAGTGGPRPPSPALSQPTRSSAPRPDKDQLRIVGLRRRAVQVAEAG